MRTDIGEFQRQSHPEANWLARGRFLDLVKEMVPEVLVDLREHVFPIYAGLDPDLQQAPTFVYTELKYGWATLINAVSESESSARLNSLIDSMLRWTHSYHLDAEWVLNRALVTLYVWLSGRDENTWHQIGVSTYGHPITQDELVYQFVRSGWDPTFWTRAHYEKEIRAAFKAHFKDYCDRVEAAAVKRGLTRTPELRSRGGEVGRRFHHLVRWQVQEWRLEAIAQETKTSVRAVCSNLGDAANELGLPLRRGRPGRPPKRSRNSAG